MENIQVLTKTNHIKKAQEKEDIMLNKERQEEVVELCQHLIQKQSYS